MLILVLVWKADGGMEKEKAKVKPIEVAAIQPVEVHIDDELMKAANVPDLGGGDDADASFDEDTGEPLLGSIAAVAQPSPAKIKIKGLRRPAPDMDDLGAVFYGTVDASSTKKPAEPPKITEQPNVPLRCPTLKVPVGGPSRASVASMQRQQSSCGANTRAMSRTSHQAGIFLCWHCLSRHCCLSQTGCQSR
jgi:hypothetical protein